MAHGCCAHWLLRLLLLGLGFAPPAWSCPEVAEWLYDKRLEDSSGYHVVCLDGGSGDEALRLRVWVGGHREAEPKEERWLPTARDSMKVLRRQIRDLANMPKLGVWKVLSWGLFDIAGGRVRRASQARGLLLAFEGGRWVWPGIREGYERSITLQLETGAAPRQFALRTLSLRPLAFTMEGLSDQGRAQHAIERATPLLKNTPEQHTDNSHRKPGARTNRQTFIQSDGDEKLEYFRRVTAAIYRVPERLQESIEVLEYLKGQKYDAHIDFFDPRAFANSPGMMQYLHNEANRMMTGLWYLSDVYEGGETFFPGRSVTETKDFDVCKGKVVQPRFGLLLFWYNIFPNATLDYNSWHGGCEVKDGAKYVINICAWNHNTPNMASVSNQADEPEAIDYVARRTQEEL